MRVRAVRVVVPACDEELLLGRCLAAIDTAAARLYGERPDLAATTVVALDRCTDRSGAIAAAAGVTTVTLVAGRVGAARRAGVARAAEHAAAHGRRPEEIWIAGTDADTLVGPDWLVRQVELAEAGADLVVGGVRPAPGELSPAEAAAWAARHPARDEEGFGGHIHGANLGFRLAAYQDVGGFPDLAEHEDVALVETMRARGVREARGPEVVTSARLQGRTPGGFAGYLRALRADLRADLQGGQPPEVVVTGS